MSWLDAFFNAGYETIQIAGVPLPQQRTVNLASGASGVDNPALQRTDIFIVEGSSGISGITVDSAGTPIGTRGTINFTDNATVADNPGAGRVDITPLTQVMVAGVKIGEEKAINFVSGASAVDNSGANRVDVTLNSGALERFTPIDANTQIEYSFESTNPVSGDNNLGHGGTLTLTTGFAVGGNPTTGVSGLFQNCWYLNGTQGLKTGDTSIGEAASAWSVVLWIFPYTLSNSADAEIFDKKYQTGNTWSAPFTSVSFTLDHTTVGNWFATMTFSGTKRFATPAGGTSSTTSFGGAAAIAVGRWQMLAMTYNGSLTQVYKDGWLAASDNGGSGSIDWGSHGAWQIGAQTTQSTGGFNGLVEEFRVYSEVLSAGTLQTMFKQGINLLDV